MKFPWDTIEEGDIKDPSDYVEVTGPDGAVYPLWYMRKKWGTFTDLDGAAWDWDSGIEKWRQK